MLTPAPRADMLDELLRHAPSPSLSKEGLGVVGCRPSLERTPKNNPLDHPRPRRYILTLGCFRYAWRAYCCSRLDKGEDKE